MEATLIDSDNLPAIDHLVSVEYASYMKVPSATNTTRYHGLSQFIQMKHPGFTVENGYIPESENNSVDTR